jgi:hypothetical protein
MNSFTEKKWFVYVGDHHEGPHSVEEIQEKVSQGQVSSESYVWAEGMPDWKVITSVPGLEAIFQKAASEVPVAIPILEPALVAEDPLVEMAPSPEPSLVSSTSPVLEDAKLSPLAIESIDELSPSLSTVQEDEATGELNPTELEKAKAIGASRKGISFSWLVSKWLITLFIVSGFVTACMYGYFDSFLKSPPVQEGMHNLAEFSRPYLLSWVDQFPILGKWVSPISFLQDVSQDEFEELKSAAREKIDSAGVRFSMALSKADVLAPFLYVASNLPDGTQLQVHVVGITDTLVNQMSFYQHFDVVLSKKLGMTTPIRFSDGKPIPRGEYMIYLSALDSQSPEVKTLLGGVQASQIKIPPELPKNLKILGFKTYFLGGNRDAGYAARLKEFHDKLRGKAASELIEIKQFTVTLDSQFSSTVTKFNLIRKGKMNLKQKKTWESFHNEWMKLQGQLDQIFLKWSSETVQNEFFYSALYRLTQQVGQTIEKVHGFQHAYFNGMQDPRTFEIQLGETAASAQTSLNLLRLKIDQAEKLPPTPNGMPRREGL